ncbi:hypothetical protein V6N11_047407 [Hibiscus sabdariffa]|uniref:Helicase C-terminal domain-containing protein n=1 Tax=Hibiscus sabdariffa TaxID=183260 RepID=A0ABR2A469_9ROSI
MKNGGLSFFSDIALLLIDEVHLLNDLRGAALEAIVSRIKMLSRNPEMKSSALASVRFLAVSATIRNIEDLVGYHNGGLSLKDRNLIEGLFFSGDVLVLCTTNTLAHGINLPAHTVVIKSTQHFNREKGLYMEYDRSMVLQMCGRAGRPPFDDTGMVIIMTRRETTDQDGFVLKPQEPGRLMTKYYLKFNTMKHIMQAPSSCSLEDVLRIICHAEEIACMYAYLGYSSDEMKKKKLLNDINGDKDDHLRFHVSGDKGKRKKRIQTREEIIFVLANDCLTGDPLVHDLSMTEDANSICSNGCRIAKCMKEYFIYKKNYRGALNSSLLAKSLYQKLWDDSPFLLKQLPGIGMVTAKALHSMGIKSFETLAEADPRRIEIVTGRKFPFGNHIKESLTSLPPKVDIKIEVSERQRQGKSKLAVTLTRLSSQGAQSTKRHYGDMLALDIHEKLLLVKESDSTPNPKRAKKPAQLFAPSQEVFVIEGGKAAKHQSLAQRPLDSIESKMESSSILSFNLLDEEPGEGELAAGMEKDDCKIITEQKRSSDQERSKIRVQIVLDPLPQSTGPEHISDGINNYLTGKHRITSGSSITIDLTDELGDIQSEPETFSFKRLTEETILDHISQNSKNFPVINTSKVIESNCFVGTEEHNSENQPGFGNTTLGASKDAMVISELEHEEANGSSSGANAETLSIKMLPFGFSMVKNSKHLADLGSTTEDGRKDKPFPSDSKRQCYLFASADQAREVDPFLGFRSVFSFL